MATLREIFDDLRKHMEALYKATAKIYGAKTPVTTDAMGRYAEFDAAMAAVQADLATLNAKVKGG